MRKSSIAILVAGALGGPAAHGNHDSQGSAWGGAPDNRYVEVGTANVIRYSNNGINWFSADEGTFADFWSNAAWGGGRFVAVGGSLGAGFSVDGKIGYSETGANWTQASVSASGKSIAGVAFHILGGRFVAVGAGGSVFYSSTGATWAPSASPTSKFLRAAAYGATPSVARVVAVGDDGTVIYTNNQTSWFSAFVPVSVTNDLEDVAFGEGRFVAVGRNGTVIYSTDGGTNWQVGLSDSSEHIYGVAYDSTNGRFIACGANGTVLYSNAGGHFAEGFIDFAGELKGIAHSPHLRRSVVNGTNGFTAVSSNGKEWGKSGSGSNYQPDLEIKVPGAKKIGNGIYNRNGRDQTGIAHRKVRAGGKVRIKVFLQNDGGKKDSILFTGAQKKRTVSYSYSANRKRFPGKQVFKLKPGEKITILIIAEIDRRSGSGKSRNTYKALSRKGSRELDVVKSIFEIR